MIRILVIIAAWTLLAEVVRASETNGPAILELNDQYGVTHVLAFPRPKPCVLTIADRNGSGQIDGWIEPLRQRFGVRVEFVGLADVSGVPRWMRSKITNQFREKYQHPVLLDWDGASVKQYGYLRRQAMLLVIDREGHIRQRAAGAADRARLE